LREQRDHARELLSEQRWNRREEVVCDCERCYDTD
jgi:hypothetical protein